MLNNALQDYFSDLKINNEMKKEAENKIKLLTNNVKDLAEEY